MSHRLVVVIVSFVVTIASAKSILSAEAVQDAPPTDWVDPATGHRVIRLSRDAGTASFYFHQEGFTAQGDKLVVSTRDGLATIDLTTIGVKPDRKSVE